MRGHVACETNAARGVTVSITPASADQATPTAFRTTPWSVRKSGKESRTIPPDLLAPSSTPARWARSDQNRCRPTRRHSSAVPDSTTTGSIAAVHESAHASPGYRRSPTSTAAPVHRPGRSACSCVTGEIVSVGIDNRQQVIRSTAKMLRAEKSNRVRHAARVDG